jgi:hypothetical protein
LPNVNDRKNDHRIDGARMRSNTAGIAPWRPRSMSSMLSAPAIIPATRQGTEGITVRENAETIGRHLNDHSRIGVCVVVRQLPGRPARRSTCRARARSEVGCCPARGQVVRVAVVGGRYQNVI